MNTEFILCAAFRLKDDAELPNIAAMKEKGCDPEKIYFEPHREVFRSVQGWRHADIIYKFGDVIDRTDTGGFMTSTGRYVSREEAAEIAFAAGQTNEKKSRLFSEDLY